MISAGFESVTHLCLKKASTQASADEGWSYYKAVLSSKLVWAGIFIYVLQIGAWLTILSHVPLSLAFPMTGVEKIIMVFVALVVLRERMSAREWWSLGIICIGLLLVGISSPGTP
jgi:drug/metabolite transporter (DMT)-like permease